MLFKTTFPKTPSGKIELQSAYLERAYSAPLPTFRPVESHYPLTLISPGSDKRTTSTFGGLRYSDEVWLDMHPHDAPHDGSADGMMVRVWNDLGEVHLRLRVTEDVRPGVICFAERRLVPHQRQWPDGVGAGPNPLCRSV